MNARALMPATASFLTSRHYRKPWSWHSHFHRHELSSGNFFWLKETSKLVYQNAAEGKEDIRSVNAEQGCAMQNWFISLLGLHHSKAPWIDTELHFTASLGQNSRSYTCQPELNSTLARFLNSNITCEVQHSRGSRSRILSITSTSRTFCEW